MEQAGQTPAMGFPAPAKPRPRARKAAGAAAGTKPAQPSRRRAAPPAPPPSVAPVDPAAHAKEAEDLRRLDLSAVPDVPNVNTPTLSRVKAIHDADTIEVVVHLGGAPFGVRIRIRGIDSPEITLKKGTSPLEKAAATAARDYVRRLLAPVALPTAVLYKLDKYGGRYVGDLCLPSGEMLSQHLLRLRLARAYDGGKKQPWTEAELNAIIAVVPRV
jgi:endonuclease YncB( thermonuclease family)